MVIGSWVTLFALIPLPVPVWLLGGQRRFASLLEAAEPEAQPCRQEEDQFNPHDQPAKLTLFPKWVQVEPPQTGPQLVGYQI